MAITAGKLAYVRVSGEPVFVLYEVKKGQVWGEYNRLAAFDGFQTRRFVMGRQNGSSYQYEFFTPPELMTKEEMQAEQEGSMLQFLQSAAAPSESTNVISIESEPELLS
jgi:hypothetical protein